VEVKDLKIHFPTDDGLVKAVDGLSFAVDRGKTLGIVGESGSGKSVTSLGILGLHNRRNAQMSGEIWVDGKELVAADPEDVRAMRGDTMAMIFQDPLSAMHPYYRVGTQIAEAYRVHNNVSKSVARDRAIELLDLVGIPEPNKRVDAYPHQFSGGMRQRAMIAMGLSNRPEILIADEPTTALDVTIQAQILDLMRELQETLGTAIVLITHDMGVVAENADRVVVMYAGRKVEEASAKDLFEQPGHPYTKGLLGSIPDVEVAAHTRTRRARLTEIKGMVPSLAELPSGCTFAPRCGLASEECRASYPPLVQYRPGHWVACWHAEQVLGGAI